MNEMEIKLKTNSLKGVESNFKKNCLTPGVVKTPIESLIDDVSSVASRLNNIQLGEELRNATTSDKKALNDFNLSSTSSIRYF